MGRVGPQFRCGVGDAAVHSSVFEFHGFSGALAPANCDQKKLITNGIWEMPSAEGKMFGKDRLREIMRMHAKEPAAVIATKLEEALMQFRGERKPKDDVTFVVARLV